MRMARMVGTMTALWLTIALVANAPAQALTAGTGSLPPLPNSMAAIGDSISQAFDVCCFYGAYPQHSWTTGDDSTDGVDSHYERILASNPLISGNEYNDSVVGATMADAPGQAQEAVAQGAQYVTILMGANDVCTSSPSTMTSTAAFSSEFQTTMSTLEAGLPAGAHVFVSSIPNVYQLWSILHTNLAAQAAWTLFQICQSMLNPLRTQAARMKVVKREVAFNRILGAVCARYANCRFDQDAVFDYRFVPSQVSTLDYFHPSLTGQATLADITWQASWWPGTQIRG